MNRTLAVFRMHLTDRITLFGLTLAILAASFTINMLIFAVEPVEARSSGGVAAIFIVLLVAAVMSTARGMWFALSMGASRRAFALGTGLTGTVLAVVFGVLLLLLNRIELATNGWGLQAHFFSFEWLESQHLAVIWLLATILLLAMFLLGGCAATIWLRWRQIGLLVTGVGLFVIFGGAAVLATWQHEWAAIGRWFSTLAPMAAVGWIALGCVAFASVSYLTLRRVAL